MNPESRTESGGVRLRDVQEADLPILFEHQRDPDAARMAAFPPRDWEAFTAHWTRILADPTITNQTILYNEQVVGNIGSWEQEGEHDVGYWIGKEYWGRGIATQALIAFLRQLTVRPLYARVAKHNSASRRVLEKGGFRVVSEDLWTVSPDNPPVEEWILILKAPDGE